MISTVLRVHYNFIIDHNNKKENSQIQQTNMKVDKNYIKYTGVSLLLLISNMNKYRYYVFNN